MKQRILTWAEFDEAVEEIARQVNGSARFVYGVPRGGLPLAVALSHRLDIPLATRPDERTLIVDDVLETGTTLAAYAAHPPELVWTWINKSDRPANAVMHDPAIGWVVFPWENRAAAERDARDYYVRRQ